MTFNRIILLLTFIATFAACSESGPTFTGNGGNATILENPTNGTVLGTVSATGDLASLTFTLLSSNPSGAFAFDPNTREVSVADRSKFNFEVNTTMAATVEVTDGKETQQITFDVNLEDMSAQAELDSGYETIATCVGYDPAFADSLIGLESDGGWIAYIDLNNSTAIIMAPDDADTAVAWWDGTWNYTNTAGLTPDSSIGSGQSNTNTIVGEQTGTNNAAQKALDYTSGGYSDWYLPSSNELRLFCNLFYGNPETNLADAQYWTSTDLNQIHNANWGFMSNCDDKRTDSDRGDLLRVRAARTAAF